MQDIKDEIMKERPKSLADFLRLSQSVEKKLASKKASDSPSLRIAFLSSFTAKGIREILLVKCCELGISPAIYIGDYNQYAQDILEPKSPLYGFDPDLVILFIDARSMLGKLHFLPYDLSDEERMEWVNWKTAELEALIQKLKENSRARILIHNFEVPHYSPLGILENKQRFGFTEAIQSMNSKLREMAKPDPRLFVFDYDAFSSHIGKRNVMDERMYYLGDVKINWTHMPALCDAYLSYIKPMASIIRKCIVVDLDNTLWGGVVGEDGFEGIRLGPTPEGRPFMEFQQCLLSLFKRGILLAINSSNNFDDAIKVIREHPHMTLREKHFAAIKINWQNKIENLEAIAKELNIGLDSLVFIDDNKANYEMVMATLPQVLVVDLPSDPALYVKTLYGINDFNTLQFTEEDARRGLLYAGQRLRKEYRARADITDYLKGLQTVVTIGEAGSFTIPRIAQLTQRTNQFNMTTRRYSEDDIKSFLNDNNFAIWSLDVTDKFGDNGIVGTAIVELSTGRWRIDTFLLSCRVIGRKIEEAFLTYILNKARLNNSRFVMGEFIPTKKNAIAKDFYKNSGFRLAGREDEKEIWEHAVDKDPVFPDHIKIVENGKI